jgi:anti-sigma factor RsiW
MTTHLATERLSAYLDDELDGRDARQVESHVLDCPRCQRRLHGLRLVVAELQRMPAVDPPEVLERAIEREVSARRRRRDQLFRRKTRPGHEIVPGLIQLSSAMAVAVAMVAILVTQGMSRRGEIETSLAAPPAEAVEPSADRVEAGGRVFVFARGAWRQQDLAGAAEGATPEPAALSREEALARAPWLADLLGRGPVVLELDGAVVAVD